MHNRFAGRPTQIDVLYWGVDWTWLARPVMSANDPKADIGQP